MAERGLEQALTDRIVETLRELGLQDVHEPANFLERRVSAYQVGISRTVSSGDDLWATDSAPRFRPWWPVASRRTPAAGPSTAGNA